MQDYVKWHLWNIDLYTHFGAVYVNGINIFTNSKMKTRQQFCSIIVRCFDYTQETMAVAEHLSRYTTLFNSLATVVIPYVPALDEA